VKYFKATIEILLEAETEVEACDAIAETMRPLMKTYARKPELTSFIDWQYLPPDWKGPVEDNGEGFELCNKHNEAINVISNASKDQG